VATFENTVMIRRPIEDVFAFLSDFENIPKWNYPIVETHKVSEGPSEWGRSSIKCVRCRAAAKSASRSPPTTSPPPGDTRPTRAIPIPPLLCPGRHCRGNPAHELGEARTPRPWPSARASRRATCPGRRGRQRQEAQGTAGPIDCGAHWGHRPTASMGQQRTTSASKRLLPTECRRSRDRPCRALKATVAPSFGDPGSRS
jgi:Polyketide cyclase / dehydrase and lipid transport